MINVFYDTRGFFAKQAEVEQRGRLTVHDPVARVTIFRFSEDAPFSYYTFPTYHRT
jgi:hypothetical protein